MLTQVCPGVPAEVTNRVARTPPEGWRLSERFGRRRSWLDSASPWDDQLARLAGLRRSCLRHHLPAPETTLTGVSKIVTMPGRGAAGPIFEALAS